MSTTKCKEDKEDVLHVQACHIIDAVMEAPAKDSAVNQSV